MAVTFVNANIGSTLSVLGITFYVMPNPRPGRPDLPYGASYVPDETFTIEMSELESYDYYPNFEASGDLYIDGVLKSDGIWTPVDGQTVTFDYDNQRIDVVSPGGGGWFNDHHL